ncbi:ABC transporter substrate-binding protein [Salinivibrio sp. ES.052]|uniref:substrate-binding periplasmic protein n=1 Tax=Salinivibrio sp. ES.052 TaxID=1882823 RepID=UPI00092AC667|nr:transporter substrate-binding domain-containing protein [Salinivibrio sp. ES.052]SIO33410.1 amino acid ABC transporter substrate-binding protein, PAAT family [Salinivibrio sp. ES.052]
MRYLLLALILVAVPATADTFRAHCRDRAPELIPTETGCEGPVAEVITVALEKMGHTPDWSTVPWARTINVAEVGEVDIIPRHSMNNEREAFLNAVPYGYSIREVFYIIGPNVNQQINSFEELKQYRIGALRDSFYSDLFNNTEDLKRRYYNDTEQIIKVLENGRIDVAVTSSSHDIDKFTAVSAFTQANFVDRFYNGRYISIPKKSPVANYFPEFERTIQQMVASGEVSAIFEKYGQTPPEQKPAN